MSAAAESKLSREGPCPAARRPCCRPTPQLSTTLCCSVERRHQNRTRDPSVRLRSQASPCQQWHRDLKQVPKQSDAKYGHNGSQSCCGPQRGVAIAKRRHEHTGESGRYQPEITAKKYEAERAGEYARPAQPFRMRRQNVFILPRGEHRRRLLRSECREKSE